MLEFIFFLSVSMIFYVYLGYPAFAALIAVTKNKKVNKCNIAPSVTILIAAFNEAENIEATIKNKLNLDYPKDKMEIIVISDGSTDGTDDIVRQYGTHGVELLRQEPRAGKTAALNMAVPKAKGEILVFSDANSIYDKEAVRKLVGNFHDPSVGYVTGKMVYTHQDGTPIGDGCSAYMKYENLLRGYETRIGSIVGVDGGVDAVRNKLYKPMSPDQLPDFVLPLKVIDQGYRVVYESEAILKEPSLKEPEDEYKMRVRVSLRALWALSDMRHLLSLKKDKLYAWQLWSHKILRYMCFILLLGAFFSNMLLMNVKPLYSFTFAAQLLAYVGAMVSPMLEKKGIKLKISYFLHYFTLLNVASAHAFVRFVFRQKQVMWTPRKG